MSSYSYGVPSNEELIIMEQVRLALVLPGAVSLGSYEAGVAFELARAVITARRINPEAPPLIIDTIVGASAGAITGALLSYILLTDGDPSWLHHAWVAHPELSELIAWRDWRSIFSMHRLKDIASEVLSDDVGIAPHVDCHTRANATPYNQPPIRYVAMLTNLTELQFRIPVLSHDTNGVPATTNRDWKAMVLTHAGAQTPDGGYSWRYVAEVALASGAFPVAFPPQTIERSASEYLNNHVLLQASPTQRIRFHFTDGGVMHNEPIGLAFDALYEPKRIGLPSAPIVDNEAVRIIILIHPHPRGDMYTIPPSGRAPLMLDVLSRVVSARFNVNDVFLDLQQAQKVNSRVHWKRIFLEEFEAWLRANPSMITPIVEMLSKVRGLVESDLHHLRKQYYVPDAINATSHNVAPDNNAITSSQEHSLANQSKDEIAHAMTLLEAVLDRISGTTGKREARIEIISPLLLADKGTPEELLCGEALGHFAGFLHRAFRENDFTVGRESAWRWLKSLDVIEPQLRTCIAEDATPSVHLWKRCIQRDATGRIVPLRKRESTGIVTLSPVRPATQLMKRGEFNLRVWLGIAVMLVRALGTFAVDGIRFCIRRWR
ncbi:MAG TPA: hypothetical protein EYP10_10855 [Armatimonadetes bacterium]|nr:hypothetical protein [Armatimonadota bacterium]